VQDTVDLQQVEQPPVQHRHDPQAGDGALVVLPVQVQPPPRGVEQREPPLTLGEAVAVLDAGPPPLSEVGALAQRLHERLGVVGYPLGEPEVVVAGGDEPGAGLGVHHVRHVLAVVHQGHMLVVVEELDLAVLVLDVVDLVQRDDLHGCVGAVDLLGDDDLAVEPGDLRPGRELYCCHGLLLRFSGLQERITRIWAFQADLGAIWAVSVWDREKN
jgi:hypothetical protein